MDPHRQHEQSPRTAGIRWEVRRAGAGLAVAAAHPLSHFVLLASLAGWSLAVSWRKWADPVVDFGRELYLAWRLAAGDVLYRDVDDFYGPLSQYANAALFRVFGESVMTLVAANLAVFAAITVLLYRLVREAWGGLAALAGTAVLVAVFGFSRFLHAGNFNYATPYSHETTHGVLVVLLLVWAAKRWLAGPSAAKSLAAGLAAGLTLVLKPEIALAAAAVVGATALGHRAAGGHWRPGWMAAWAAGAVVPTAVFAWYFARHLGWAEGLASACRAWLNVVATTRYVREPAQMNYSGFDAPWPRLLEHLQATAVAAVCLGAISLGARLGGAASSGNGWRWAGMGLVAVVGAAGWVLPAGIWIAAGRCLLPLLLVYLGVVLWRGLTRREPQPVPVRWLLAVAGAALMARMALNGRIYHFGYYQAAIAAVAVAAVAVAELPAWIAGTGRGRRIAAAGTVVFLAGGVAVLGDASRRNYSGLVAEFGSGADGMRVHPAAAPLGRLVEELRKLPRDTTLLVLPEGLMLNYQARLRSPLPHFFYYSVVTEHGREAEVVRALAKAPPDYVVTLPRDLREYGIARYGERPGGGGDLLAWIGTTYESAMTDEHGVPAVYSTAEVQVFRRKTPRGEGGR